MTLGITSIFAHDNKLRILQTHLQCNLSNWIMQVIRKHTKIHSNDNKIKTEY